MHILLLGNTGQLGFELERTLALLGDVYALDYPAINLVDVDRTRNIVFEARPQIIVNATAYTAVDRAESEPELAAAINAKAPGILAEAAQSIGAALIHFSTDYVFDGRKGETYLETDTPNPLNVYGKTKLAGEQAIQQVGGVYLIFRTSWVYSLRRDSFVTKILGWGRERRVLSLVTDQIGNPTWCRMLAEAATHLLGCVGGDMLAWLEERKGLYHLAGEGYASRLEWGQEILRCDPKRQEQVVEQVLPAKTADFPSPAQRPLFSALNCDRFYKTFGFKLPAWQKALQLAMESRT
jgi:dTDP-4-dehydrorhamnose reductase